VLETCRGMNKLIVKQKFCASSWLITEINILKCTVSKTSKFILVSFYSNKNFLDILSKNTQISNNIRIRPVGAELTEGWTDRHDEVIVSFRKFVKAPKSSTVCAHRVFMYFVWISKQTAISFN